MQLTKIQIYSMMWVTDHLQEIGCERGEHRQWSCIMKKNPSTPSTKEITAFVFSSEIHHHHHHHHQRIKNQQKSAPLSHGCAHLTGY